MATAMSQTPKTDHRLGFTSLEEETAVDSLPVTGQLPSWLSGALVRVTPAKLEAGERRLDHWFDGIAMLNRFGIADGRVSYKSRFIDSMAYRDAQEGEWSRRGFATDPCRSLFKRVQSMFSPNLTDNPNVNLSRIGERYIAMTETPMPIEFDPETLETVGQLEYADKLKAHTTTAHPHHDPERNELVNYHAFFSRVSKYVLYGVPAESPRRRVIAELPVKEPSYMHAFGMSERHLILTEYPLRANPLKMAFSGKPFIQNYVWRPQEGTKFQVVDRETGAVRTYETGAFFCFHHVNAFERAGGSELVVDLIAYDDPSIIDALYLDADGPRGSIPSTELRRYVIDLDGGGVTYEKLAEDVELPRIDYGRRNTRPYRYVYCSRSVEGWFDQLVKVDVGGGPEAVWSAPGCYAGEPIFVREPGRDDEDAGVVLSVVLDANAGRSFLLVLDAHSFEELARAEAPHHIPFGFHGQFLRN